MLFHNKRRRAKRVRKFFKFYTPSALFKCFFTIEFFLYLWKVGGGGAGPPGPPPPPSSYGHDLSLCPSVCPSVHSVSIHSVFRTFLSCLWDIDLKFGIWIYLEILQIKFDVCLVWPTFTGVITLCKNLVFRTFLVPLYDIDPKFGTVDGFIIPSQQRWRGYSNAAIRGWLGEWVGACVSGWIRMCVRHALPCGHDSD